MDLESESPQIESRSPRTIKFARLIGLGFIPLAILFVALAITSSASTSFEPRWLTQIETKQHRIEYVELQPATSMALKHPAGLMVQQTLRSVKMDFEAFVAKMRVDVNSKHGWEEFIPLTSRSVTWSRHDATGDYTIWAIPDPGGQLAVSSSCLRSPTWIERAKHWAGMDKPSKAPRPGL